MSVPGGSASFSCVPSPLSNDPIDSAIWLANGTLLTELDPKLFASVFFAGTTLSLNNVPFEFNNTRLQCWAMLASGVNRTSQMGAFLYIQGAYHCQSGRRALQKFDSGFNEFI